MSSTGSKRNRFSRRLEAVYRKGFEDGKEALAPAAKLEARRIKLGKRQLETLLSVGCTSAMIVPTPITKRLCKIGLMKSHGPNGSFASMTTSGLRALADAVDAGSAELFVMPTDKAALASGANSHD